MTSTEPKIDQLTGTVISEQGGGEIVDGRQDPPMSVYADDESVDGGATPSMFATDEETQRLWEERKVAVREEAAEVYALIEHVAENVIRDRGGDEQDVHDTVATAFAVWLGNAAH